MAVNVVPARSRDQRMEGLRRANEIRGHRKRWRAERLREERDVATNHARALITLVPTPDWCVTMRVETVLTHLPWFGPARTRRVLAVAGVHPNRTVGGLTDRQRDALDQALADTWAGRSEARR